MPKIKIILFILFLLSVISGFFSSCLPEHIAENPSRHNREEYYLSDEDEDHSEFLSNPESQKKTIRETQKRQIQKGQKAVESNIKYLKELEKNNENLLQNRETEGSEPTINEDDIKKLQKKGKDLHFENLKNLLNTEGRE